MLISRLLESLDQFASMQDSAYLLETTKCVKKICEHLKKRLSAAWGLMIRKKLSLILTVLVSSQQLNIQAVYKCRAVG